MARPSSAGGRKTDTTHDLAIYGVGSEGEGVGRLADGRVAFVHGALPGDTVRAAVTNDKGRLVFADAVEILKPSPDRVDSVCALDACSGCPLKRLAYAAQLAAKREHVLQSLQRLAKLDAAGVFGGVTPAREIWGYRHRARLHARYDGQWRLGYFARGSHDLVPVDTCPVLWPELDVAVKALAAWVRVKPKSIRLREIEVAWSRLDGRAAAEIHADGDIMAEGAPCAVQIGDVRYGDTHLRYDQPRDFALAFEPGAFTQAHPAMNERLVEAVLAACNGERILELHSGIGNFSLPLTQAGHEVRAVEQNPRASALALVNARSAQLTIDTVAATDADAVADADRYDVVLLDPPRTGASAVARALAHRGPRQIVYVSCDPATLARDLQTLTGGGYALAALTAFDMFPLTPHVESLAVLTRSST